jgi:hypothetical protein
MRHHIIRQSDGKYAVWSTRIDNFILTDASKADLISFFAEEERRRATEVVKHALQTQDVGVNAEKRERDEETYSQFTTSRDEALTQHQAAHAKPLDFEQPRLADWAEVIDRR